MTHEIIKDMSSPLEMSIDLTTKIAILLYLLAELIYIIYNYYIIVYFPDTKLHLF